MLATMTAEELVQPVADEIRRTAAQAEAERRIPDDLLQKLMDAGLFSIYTPREFGGQDLPLPDALRVVEEVSRHDGSTGWTVALGFANGFFASVLPEASASNVLGNGSVLIAGAPAFGVRAVRVDGGYRLTGRWPFNSGAPNAGWIGAAAPIFDGDAPRMREHAPEMVFAFMPPADVQIIDTWYVTGLRASGTQDLYVEDLFVPDEMTGGFSIPEGPQPARECLYTNIPLFSLLGVVQAPPVCLGLARRAIEEFRQIAVTKQSPLGPRLIEQVQAHVGFARAEALVRSARTYWYDNVRAIWDVASAGRQPSPEERTSLRLATLTAAEHSVEAIDILYRLAGTSAIFQSSPLERCWRDVHTAAQHMQVQEFRWETPGRALLGLEPGSPIL
jgi:alkylation response protein AidB-like acyl-CoA dehydrogenase